MFAKRHRRSEEEQPLVPHGLVWQAMEDMASAEKSEAEVKTPNPLPGPPHLVPPPIRLPSSKPPSLINDDSTGGSVVFWKKLAKPTLVKLSRFDDSTAPLSTSDRVATSLERTRKFLSPNLNRIRRSWNTIHLDFAKAGRELLRRLDVGGRAVQYRRFVAGVGQRGTAYLSVRTRVLKAELLQSLKRRRVAARKIIVAHTKNLSATARRGYEELKVRTRAYRAASAQRVSAESIAGESFGATHGSFPVALPSAEPLAVVTPPSPAFVPAQSQTQKSGTPHSNARVRTSFAMAGLLALLVLGLVSAVQHYAAQDLPSQVLRHNSSPAPMPASTTHAGTNAISQKSNPKAKAVHPSHAVGIDSSRRASVARAVKPKRRSNEDDDYVAPDTFVSYGKRPNTSH